MFVTIMIDYDPPDQASYRAVRLEFEDARRNVEFASGDPVRDFLMALTVIDAAHLRVLYGPSNVADFVDCGPAYRLDSRPDFFGGKEMIIRQEGV